MPIYCKIPNLNSSIDYKIDIADFEYFNKTKIATIGTKLIFTCNNHTNSTDKTFIQFCNRNGKWEGPQPKCKL